MKETDIRKYRPSNGTEGDGFMSNHCYQCIHEKFIHTNQHGKQCDILDRTMMHGVDDEEYPTEWVYNENNKPTCTNWEKWDWGNDGDPDDPDNPKAPVVEDPNQLCLPFELMAIEQEETKELVELNNA
jgi:hypothetical protein